MKTNMAYRHCTPKVEPNNSAIHSLQLAIIALKEGNDNRAIAMAAIAIEDISGQIVYLKDE